MLTPEGGQPCFPGMDKLGMLLEGQCFLQWAIGELVSFQWNRRFSLSKRPEVETSYAKLQVAPRNATDVEVKLPNVAFAVMVLG